MLLLTQPHRRFNPLKNEWILVSPGRTKRPWNGKQETAQTEQQPTHDPNCNLCPGNTRASGEKNPQYTSTFVFQNDYPAMRDESGDSVSIEQSESDALFNAEAVHGACKVVCFSPRHDLTLAQMTPEQIFQTISAFINQMNELKTQHHWVQVFENKGALMGCSNPHPHGQVWASNFVPNELAREDENQKIYFEKHSSPLLVNYLESELNKKERVVTENNEWAVIVPFWATWPFETMVLPKFHISNMTALTNDQITSLAEMTQKLLIAYDRLFETSMPYSMGWHFAPFNNQENAHWQLHAHYYPPLLRSATVKKFMVGYEMLAQAQRDLTPEEATQQLKALI